jgi:hypothetical protein
MIQMPPSPADMDMVLERCFLTNEYTDKLTEIPIHVAKSGKSSMSFQRQMDNSKDFIRGNPSNLPFFPGGMVSEEKKVTQETFEDILSSLQGKALLNFKVRTLTHDSSWISKRNVV